tara:strand:+ start:229 stop:1035 length:807 start_codon:yes stop_codon:yes gene_type:complete
MYFDRQEFIEEVNEEKILREYVRKAIKIVHERKKTAKNLILEEKNKLRSIIKTLVAEAKISDPEEAPHGSTGINVLEGLLKKIIPIIEDEFKKLTTSNEQRISFRSHIINAVKDSLAPPKVTDKADVKARASLSEQNDVDITIQDTDGKEGFIDIQPSEKKSDKEVAKDEFSLEGEDETGRDMAYDTFKRIESNIVDAWDMLYADEDKELFYDYLITNLKLYFDKFEDELKTSLPEPTTPEYEEEKAAEETPGAEEIPAEIQPEEDFG